MKSLVVVLLVAMTAASSLTAASDTLKVISYRSIDVCSGERSWLIAFSIGEVFASDSLQSFDITVGYDTSRITPTDLLISGTLADQMRFGDVSPFMTTIVPGELRVGGFTVTRNVRGDLPLVAVSGSYKGDCGDADTFYLAYNPNSGFNDEFKGEITTFISDSVVAIANPVVDATQGPQFDVDTVYIHGKDSTGMATVMVRQSALRSQSVVETLVIEDQGLVKIDSISIGGADSVVIDPAGTEARVYRSELDEDSVSYIVHLRSLTDAEDTLVSMRIATAVTTDCGCVTPTRTDSITLRSQQKTTSIRETDVHESTDLTIRHLGETLELQCSHGQLWNVIVVDVTGRQVASATVTPEITSRLSLSPLPRGTYIVYATDGRRTQGLTIAK